MNTPYVYVKGEDNEELTEIVAGSIVDAGGTWVARIWADFDGHDEVAAEIVQAVNSHGALVEACKGIIDVIDKIKPLPTGGIPLKKAYDALDAALKLAGVK